MLRRYPSLQYALAFLTCAALVVPMSACDAIGSFTEDDEDAPEVEIGQFEMALSGALQDTLSGLAVFSTTTKEHPDTGEEVTLFGLAFMPDSADAFASDAASSKTAPQTWFASQIVRVSDRPDDGEYAFAQIDKNSFPDDIWSFPEESFAFSFQTEDTVRSAVVASQSGTLNITNSTSATLSGRFEVETAGLVHVYSASDRPSEGTITIEGEFKALGGALPEGTF